MIHVLLLQNDLLFGPEIQLSATELEALNFARVHGGESRALCRQLSSAERNMFHHKPSEGFDIDFMNHSSCACNPQNGNSKVLFHAHNLLYDARLFSLFLEKCRVTKRRHKLVITTMDFAEAVFSIEENNKNTARTRLGDQISLLAVSISCSIAEFRLLQLKREASIYLLDIDEFNNDHEVKQLELYDWLGIKQTVISPDSLSVRGAKWTGGFTPPFGARVRESSGSKRTRQFLNFLRPSGRFGLRGLSMFVAQIPVDFAAAAILLVGLLCPSRVKVDDLTASKDFLLSRISFFKELIRATRNFIC